ncbi:hypothetical protein FAF44_52270 [Nonomuraea sp. MG754425]|nr:hypothetical protein [Nonomuraea sp. MG754425]
MGGGGQDGRSRLAHSRSQAEGRDLSPGGGTLSHRLRLGSFRGLCWPARPPADVHGHWSGPGDGAQKEEITGISPASGPDSGGTTATITGHEFDPQDSQCFAGSVTFGGVSATFGMLRARGAAVPDIARKLVIPATCPPRCAPGRPGCGPSSTPSKPAPRPAASSSPPTTARSRSAAPRCSASCTRRSSALPWAR